MVMLVIWVVQDPTGKSAEKVPETEEYDHVGIKNCLFNNYTPRIDDRISKGRRAFHSVSGSGI